MRHFETGATRDTDEGKHDYEGYLSPLVIRRFGEYMTKHRYQADGQVRASDNWQKGIPKDAYIKSKMRHDLDFWLLHRGYPVSDPKTGEPLSIEEALCAIIFNAQGYLHEILKEKLATANHAANQAAPVPVFVYNPNPPATAGPFDLPTMPKLAAF